MPAKRTAKKTTKTETKSKKGRKVKEGQAYECGVCGFRLVVDDCGLVEEHYLICCSEAMTQKRAKKPAKKTAAAAPKKTAKKAAAPTPKKTAKKPAEKTTKKK